jgi:hypothetical protein
MSNVVYLPGTCGTCAASHPHGSNQIECRLNPPTPLLLGVQKHPIEGMNPQPVVNAFFPVLGTHFFCSQYRPKPGVSS